MRTISLLALTVLCMGCPALIASAADAELPWAFKGKAAEGYSIDLVSLDPAPGTVLQTGERVGFKITVSYAMSIAEQGRIVLVFQDENNRQVRSGEQVAIGGERPRGQSLARRDRHGAQACERAQALRAADPGGPQRNRWRAHVQISGQAGSHEQTLTRSACT